MSDISRLALEWDVVDRTLLGDDTIAQIHARSALASRLRTTVCHTDIPSVYETHLAYSKPREVTIHELASPGLSSPIIEEVRARSLVADFKPLSDLVARTLDTASLEYWTQQFSSFTGGTLDKSRDQLLKDYLNAVYQEEVAPSDDTSGLFTSNTRIESASPTEQRVFDYIESLWPKLCKMPPHCSTGSMLPTPYPFMIPAGRFKETYYWDTGFGVEGLLACGHLEAAQMQADNMLEQIRHFGFIPNGNRDYYLSRSQPPLSSQVVRSVTEATANYAQHTGDTGLQHRLQKWLTDRAVPLLAREFEQFWSDKSRRYDSNYGLHHHWDELEGTRPERFSTDDEEGLGNTLRDVRAMAESGLDFTGVYNGASGRNEMTSFAPVLLNALLAGFAENIAWLSARCGLEKEQNHFSAIASQRRAAIDRFLWDPASGHYRSRNLNTGESSIALDFTTFAPLYVGIASADQANAVQASAASLIKSGGLASSTIAPSVHQWDGNNGWAPAQMMAVGGLLRYGFRKSADEISAGWLQSINTVFEQYGGLYERLDVVRGDLPPLAEHQYPVQEGFLWTNASYVWLQKHAGRLRIRHSAPTPASA